LVRNAFCGAAGVLRHYEITRSKKLGKSECCEKERIANKKAKSWLGGVGQVVTGNSRNPPPPPNQIESRVIYQKRLEKKEAGRGDRDTKGRTVGVRSGLR